MSLLLLFQGGGAPPAAPTQTGGGWLTAEQAAAQLREIRRREKQEDDHRAALKAKARELEETIANAYNKAVGKPVLRKALQDVEAPEKFTPESVYEIGEEIRSKIASAVGPGKRFNEDRANLETLERALVEFEQMLNRQIEDDYRIAAMLLLAVI